MPATLMDIQWRLRLAWLYVAVAGILGLLLALLTPPFFQPDETAHAFRAIQVGHHHLFARATEDGYGGAVDSNAYTVASGLFQLELQVEKVSPVKRPDGRLTPEQFHAVETKRWSGKARDASFRNTAAYPPWLYLPQAAAWRIGEASNLTITHSLLLARLAALIAAVALGWITLRVCAAGQALFFAVLLLPSLLSLNASASQDALLYSVLALAVSLTTRPLVAARPFTGAELTIVALLLMLASGARQPYACLALLLFLPAVNLPRLSLRSLLAPSVAFVAVAAYVAAWRHIAAPAGLLISFDANPAIQAAFLRSHPVHVAAVIVLELLRRIPTFTIKVLALLGYSDVFAPPVVYALLAVGLGLLSISTPVGCLRNWRSRMLVVSSIGAMTLMLGVAEYLIWTAPGASRVDGLLPRYFLPLPMFLLLLLPLHTSRWQQTARKLQIAGMVLFLAGVVAIPLYAPHRFWRLDLLSALRLTLPHHEP